MYNHIWFPYNLLRNTFDSHKKEFHIELNIWNVATFLNQVCRAILGNREGSYVSPKHRPSGLSLRCYLWKAGLGLASKYAETD